MKSLSSYNILTYVCFWLNPLYVILTKKKTTQLFKNKHNPCYYSLSEPDSAEIDLSYKRNSDHLLNGTQN